MVGRRSAIVSAVQHRLNNSINNSVFVSSIYTDKCSGSPRLLVHSMHNLWNDAKFMLWLWYRKDETDSDDISSESEAEGT